MKQKTQLLFAALLASVTLHAQVAGRLAGSVEDPTGAVIPNARVSLYLPGGATPVMTTQTTSEGLFDFAAVRPDFYRLTVENPGFTTYTQENVKVDPSRVTSLPPIKLEVTATTQTVEVN